MAYLHSPFPQIVYEIGIAHLPLVLSSFDYSTGFELQLRFPIKARALLQ